MSILGCMETTGSETGHSYNLYFGLGVFFFFCVCVFKYIFCVSIELKDPKVMVFKMIN